MGALHQISFTTFSSLVVRLWRNAGAGVMRDARHRRGAWRRSSHLLAKLVPDVLRTLSRKTVAFTQSYCFYAETTRITQNNIILQNNEIKQHNGIMHINNSLAGRFKLKQGTLPVQCLTAGAATLPSIHNVFSQILRKHYAYFPNFYAKNFMQSGRQLGLGSRHRRETD